MKRSISFTVFGTPKPQGSTRAFQPKGLRHPVVTHVSGKELNAWRQDVTVMAAREMRAGGVSLTEEGVCVYIDFYFGRPKSLKKAVTQKTTKPDIDKLLRSVLDSLTGTVFRDDSQVIASAQTKRFGDPERAEVTVEWGAA